MQSIYIKMIERRLFPQGDDQEITHLGEDAKAKDIPEGMVVMLRVLEGNEAGKGYHVEKVPATLGRDALCDISISDTRMSRQHAMLFYYAANFYIKDLGSTNGTFVHEKRIKQSELKNGDEIRVGSTKLEFIVSNTESP